MWIAIPYQPHEALQPPTTGYAHVVPLWFPLWGKTGQWGQAMLSTQKISASQQSRVAANNLQRIFPAIYW